MKRKNTVFSYAKVFDVLQNTFCKGSAGLYKETVKAMLTECLRDSSPDGEIILEAEPDARINGIGTALLTAFEQTGQGEKLYLHTDDACTYQFYENRGLDRVCETDIVLDMGNKQAPWSVYLQ